MSFKIAVASGKGGTGKTTVSVNLYQAVSKQLSSSVLLVDCDVEEPNTVLFFPEAKLTDEIPVDQLIPVIDRDKCTYCRKCVEYCEFNAIVVIPPVRFAEVNSSLCHSCGACAVACEYDAISERAESIGKLKRYRLGAGKGILEGNLKIGSAMQTMVIRSLKKAIPGDVDIVILDAPPGTSCPVVETLSDADFVLLVAEPTPFGLHDLKLMVGMIREAGKTFGVVVNKSNLGDRELYAYLDRESIEITGEIPFSLAYASQYARGDLFSNIPDEIREAYEGIVTKLFNRSSVT
jgi:MinD superfamily P-loop ATPase